MRFGLHFSSVPGPPVLSSSACPGLSNASLAHPALNLVLVSYRFGPGPACSCSCC